MGELLDKFNELKANVSAELYDNAPVIAITVGTVAIVGGAVWACKKTLQLPQVLDDAKTDISNVKESIPATGDTKREYSKALAKSYGKAAWNVIKLYRGPVIIATLGLSSVVAGTTEFQSRNAALTATVSSLETMYARYRKNVIDRYGEEVDAEMRFGLKRETVKEKVKDEKTGKTKTVERTILTMPDGNVFDDVSEYAKVWESGASTYYDEGSREYNVLFLQQAQENANRILKRKGYLFLNEVYEMLGFPPTEAGTRVGWIYDRKHKVTDPDYAGDNQVDFRLIPVNGPGKAEFIDGFSPYMIIDPNVDGDITKDGLFIRNHMYRNW